MLSKRLLLNSGICFTLGIVFLFASEILNITSRTETNLFVLLLTLTGLMIFMLTYVLINKITAKTGDVIVSTVFGLMFLFCYFSSLFGLNESSVSVHILVFFILDFLTVIFLNIYSKMKVFVNKNRHYDKKPYWYFRRPGEVYFGYNHNKYEFFKQENMSVDYSKVFRNLAFACLFLQLCFSAFAIIFN